MDPRSRPASWVALSDRATMSSFNPDTPQTGRKRRVEDHYAAEDEDDDEVTYLYTRPKRARTSHNPPERTAQTPPARTAQIPPARTAQIPPPGIPYPISYSTAPIPPLGTPYPISYSTAPIPPLGIPYNPSTHSPRKKATPWRSRNPGIPPHPSSSPSTNQEEKRLRRFRPRPPQSYLEIKERALTQRFTVLSRERCGTDDAPEEKVIMAGTTGNVYTQHIRHIPRCDCPHAKKGNQCKHLIYVMLRVLKAPERLGYQLALMSSELRDIFARAPPIPGVGDDGGDGAEKNADNNGNRKPIEGDCPICYTEFEPAHEAIVYCALGCGNNVHKSCMQSWTKASRGKATCPYCRASWPENASLEKGMQLGKMDLESMGRNEEGYVNVASQLGLSGVREYSSYYEPWMNRHRYERY